MRKPIAYLHIPTRYVELADHVVFKTPTIAQVGQHPVGLYLKRPWVGLTDDEIKDIIGSWGDTPIKGYTRKLFDQVEAKLKEKNYD